MSSLEASSTDTALPPALRSMWRLCKLGYQHEPGLMLVAFILALLAALPDASGLAVLNCRRPSARPRAGGGSHLLSRGLQVRALPGALSSLRPSPRRGVDRRVRDEAALGVAHEKSLTWDSRWLQAGQSSSKERIKTPTQAG